MPQRPHLDLVGHQKFTVSQIFRDAISINNVIVTTAKDSEKWLEESTRLIGEWRAIFRSIYIKWALAINGLHVAQTKYADPTWQLNQQFTVNSVRADPSGSAQEIEIAHWSGPDTQKHHAAVIPYIAGWGIIDLGSALEEFIFDLYRVCHWQHPELLISGAEFKELRKLLRESTNTPADQAKWEAAFEERLTAWQRNAVYKPKRELFIAYCTHAGLKTPSTYTHTKVETWADSLDGVFILRNSLIHPNATVPKELADFCKGKLNLGYDFKEGDTMAVDMRHLQFTECFLDQLLTGINLSLVERRGLPLPGGKP